MKTKLTEMVSGRSKDRLRIAVLYFLTSIIAVPIKTWPNVTQVDDSCLRAANDLTFCKTFS